MRDTFVKTLFNIAKKDKNVHLITGDLGFGVLKDFFEKLPDQITNVGIAEQNMTGFATGMALEGKKVFTYSIGNFPTLRTLEQIRNDAAYHEVNLKIVCIGAGFSYGALGMSHHATEDIAIMRALPNVKVYSPADSFEAEEVTKLIYKSSGVCYLRLSRGTKKNIHEKQIDLFNNKSIQLKNGDKIAILFTGSIGEEAIAAEKELRQKNYNIGLYSFPIIKPLNKERLEKIIQKYKLLVTVEEHNIIGGFGSSINDFVSQITGNKPDLLNIGIDDKYSSIVGSQKYLRDKYNISSRSIVEKILNKWEEIQNNESKG